MLTRRQLLLSAAVCGIPVTAAVAFPHQPRRGLRLGLLQSQAPFIDPHDIVGSRQRAFTAYRLLIQRSLKEHGPLDWVAGGAFPLSGSGPFSKGELAQLALTDGCAELNTLAVIATVNQLQLTLGTWWRARDGGVTHRLLTFDNRGEYRVSRVPAAQTSDGVAVHMTARAGTPSLENLAADCRRSGCYGARIETLRGPAVPPGVRPAMLRGSALVDPGGALIAHADMQAETCLVAQLA